MKRHQKFGAAFALVSLGGSAMAFALWSASGVGTSQAKALSAQNLTVSAATATADLYPGYTAGNIALTVSNPNPYPVTVTGMTPGTVSTSSGSCTASNITVASASGLSISLPANSTNNPVTIPGVVSMSSSAPDACQGVTFTINVTLSGSQS